MIERVEGIRRGEKSRLGGRCEEKMRGREEEEGMRRGGDVEWCIKRGEELREGEDERRRGGKVENMEEKKRKENGWRRGEEKERRNGEEEKRRSEEKRRRGEEIRRVGD